MKKVKSIKKKQLMWVDEFSLDYGNISINNHNNKLGRPYERYIQFIKGNKLEWNSK